MDRKMAEVARRKQREDSIWLVAGMRVKAKNLYEALFVNDPYGSYRQCAVYSVLEDLWFRSRDDDREEGDDLEANFEFYCDICHKFMEPEKFQRLLDEIEPLTGPVALDKTGCQCCGDVLDVDELGFSSCCDSLICRGCRLTSDGEFCGACGAEKSPVDVLALLADD